MAAVPQTWNFIDKSAWLEGPWKTEPDKVQWTDAGTGLPCLIVRNRSGALCGYVGVAPGHPFYERHNGNDMCREHLFDNLRAATEAIQSKGKVPMPERPACAECDRVKATIDQRIEQLNCHGGITYAGPCQVAEPGNEWVICHTAEGDPRWWLGFDCAHAGDKCPAHDIIPGIAEINEKYRGRVPEDIYRDVPYVQAECAKLATQLDRYDETVT